MTILSVLQMQSQITYAQTCNIAFKVNSINCSCFHSQLHFNYVQHTLTQLVMIIFSLRVVWYYIVCNSMTLHGLKIHHF